MNKKILGLVCRNSPYDSIDVHVMTEKFFIRRAGDKASPQACLGLGFVQRGVGFGYLLSIRIS